jgi:uncharacterized protein (TIGR02117 family)
LLVVLLVALLAACSAAPRRPAPESSDSDRVAETAATVYVVKRGWHVDVGIGASDLTGVLSQVRASFPGTHYVLFGFGDRHYLLHRNGSTLMSALLPGPGLVLATSIPRPLEQTFDADDVVQIRITRSGMDALQAYVTRTLAVTDGGAIEAVESGPYASSRYYESTQRYSAVYTCNTWAADALSTAGLPVRATGVAFAGTLWRQVRPLRAPGGAAPQFGNATP